MKILHLIPGYGGGIGSIVQNLIVYSSSESVKHDVALFSCNNGEDFVRTINNFHGNVYLMPRPKSAGIKTFVTYIRTLLYENNYDVIHCHTYGIRSYFFKLLVKRYSNALFCVHAHRTANDPNIFKNNYIYTRIEQFFSVKAADLKFACGKDASSFIYGDSSAVLIHNGVNKNKINEARYTNKIDYCTSLGINPKECILLSVGRYTQQKNYPFLLKVLKGLKTRGYAFKLLAVGTGPLHDQIKRNASELNLDANIVFLDRRLDVFNLMQISDCLLLPSLYEGLPTVVVEAQAMGLRSLVSNKITKETDLGLNIVDFLPIDNHDLWIEKIINSNFDKLKDFEKIDNTLECQNYTGQTSADNYIQVLQEALSQI